MLLRLALVLLLSAVPLFAQGSPDFAAAREETVKLLSGLIRIDTSNPPGNETRAAEYIRDLLRREGIAAEVIESAPSRGNVVARLKGSGKKQPLLLMGHIDVVGVERDKWTVDPFAAVLKEGYLYGRGAADDKGMVAANLQVFLLLKRLGVKLDRDVIFLAEGGEEGTPEFGIEYLIAQHWDKIACEYALNEGGEAHLDRGQVEYIGIGTTEKVPRGLRLTARGSSGHGSMPRLDNPVVHLAAAVAKLGQWQPPMRLNETTRAFFARLATISPSEEAYLYTHLDDPAVQERLRAADIRANSMLRTSLTPTMIQGGFRTNVIPGDAAAYLDVRALPDENMDALLATLRQLINDPAVIIEPAEKQHRPVTPPSRLDSDAFRALESAQRKVFPEAITLPIMLTGATDSAQLREKGVQAYGIKIPGTDDDLKRVHGNDERVSVEGLGKFVEFVWHATVELAAAK